MGLSWASWVSPPISYYAPPYNTAPPSTSASLSTTPLSLDGTASNSSSSYNNLPMTPMLVISYCMWYPVLLSLVVSLAQHSPPDTLSHPCSLQMGRFIPYDFLPCFPKGLAMGHVYSHLHDVFAMLLMASLIPPASIYLDPLYPSSCSGAPVSRFYLSPLASYLVSSNLPCFVSLFPPFCPVQLIN